MKNLKNINKSIFYNNTINRKCERPIAKRGLRRLFADENLKFANAYDVKIVNIHERKLAEFNCEFCK